MIGLTKCPKCKTGHLILFEPGVRVHRHLHWEGARLVVDQNQPIEFEEDGGEERLECTGCEYSKSLNEIEWR